MLLILLEQPGKIVTKDELGRRLWGSDALIEVDDSLYVVAGKLREALGDRAVNPRFFKNIQGRGYQFIGDVTSSFEPYAIGNAVVEGSDNAGDVLGASSDVPSLSRARRFAFWSGLTFVGLIVFCAAMYKYVNRSLVSDQDRVVVGSFINSTGNPDLDGTLSSAVQLKLQESPYLSLVSDQKFRAKLKAVKQMTFEAELQTCSSLDAQVLLKGRILPKTQGYQISLSAWRCGTGGLLTTQEADATTQASILSAVDLATERMRRRLGEPEASLQKFNVPLMQATTASLAALKAFTLGEETRFDPNGGAIASYRLAIDLDPQFALAYARLGTAYYNTSHYALGMQYNKKAFDLRGRATDRERLYIITHYYEFATGETLLAIEDYERWRTIYPRDAVPLNNLANIYLTMGQPEKALPFALRVIQLDPTNEALYGNLAFAYLGLGEYAKVDGLCKDPVHTLRAPIYFRRVCFRAAAAEDDDAGMQRILESVRGNPQENLVVDDYAWVAMSRGQVAKARELFFHARQNAIEQGALDYSTSIQLDKVSIEADFGYLAYAAADLKVITTLETEDPAEQASAARAAAKTGNLVRAEYLAKAANARAPLNTIVNAALLAAARSEIHAQKRQYAAAIQSLEQTRPYDFCVAMDLSPGYYRGLAYIQAKKFEQAAAEFQRVIEHRAQADFPIYVILSELELAHTQELLGNRKAAEKGFQALKHLWENADSGFLPLSKLHAYENLHKTTSLVGSSSR
ncbi:winged helix-turn-helix domain-containing protein [Terriglobus saanensis]|nr:winged helix-turn-helix domain-containing protein [Terriglobus saanensis]